MKANGAAQRVAPCGFHRLPDGWWIELGVQLDESTGGFQPFVRMGQGSKIDGPWCSAHVFRALAGSAASLVELVDAGVFIPVKPGPPPGPRLLDALGGPIPESPA